ncbi:hypothetical protein C5167_013402 [Papaver somniferum]|uniref:Uncharacterized protein n=1 Tax=Papaver somniferum TaxID=3469 RepID=A0A4Y7J3A5_PAPSO|nr:hypothetical protein C5167_013402 [Papaver somniferum]
MTPNLVLITPYYEQSSFFSPSLLLFSLSCPQLAPQLAKPPPPITTDNITRNVDGRIVPSADDEVMEVDDVLLDMYCYQQFLFKNMLWCVLHTTDFSDGELKEELFSVRIASIERYWDYSPCILFFEELKGAVASAFVDFTTSPSSAEYNCLVNEIVDPSGMLYDVYGILRRCFPRSYD